VAKQLMHLTHRATGLCFDFVSSWWL
jgi:hypothetical protein